MKKIPVYAGIVASGLTILFLPECSRSDLLIVTVLAFFEARYFTGLIVKEVEKVAARRSALMALRWVRRDPPKIVSMKPRFESPVIWEDDGYILFEDLTGGADNARAVR